MITHASIKSRAFNSKKFDKQAIDKGWGLHNFVGQLKLDATCAEDVETLFNLYKYIFGYEIKGRLVIFDENEKPVMEVCPNEKELLFLKDNSNAPAKVVEISK